MVSHTLRSTSTTQAVISLSSGESDFDAVVKGTSAGIGAVSMLKVLAVDPSEHSNIVPRYWKPELMRPMVKALQSRRGAGRIRHIATPTLRISKLTQDGKVNITKVPVLRTEPILEPNTLMEARFKKCWSSAMVTFGKVDLVLRCVQKCKKSRANILVFSVWTTQLPLKHSRSQSRLNTGEPIDAQVEYLVVDEHKVTVRWRTLTHHEEWRECKGAATTV